MPAHCHSLSPEERRVPATRDGNRYKISVYPRIPNSIGADAGLSFVPVGMGAGTILNLTVFF